MKPGDTVKYLHINGSKCDAVVRAVNDDKTLDLDVQDPLDPEGARTFPTAGTPKGTTPCTWS